MSDHFSWLLFSFRGRIGRATFAKVVFAQVALSFAFQIFVLQRYIVMVPDAAQKMRPTLHAPPSVSLILMGLVLLSLWISFAVHIKRLHDFGWSGWWVLAPTGVFLPGLLLSAPFFLLGHAAVGAIIAAVACFALAVVTLGLVGMMFFRRGDEGENGHPRGPGAGTQVRSIEAVLAPSHAPQAEASTYRAARRPGEFGRRGVRA
jgi:uncharacterized membrane protein YhaH (DUF805 family)